jgi:ABC-type transport system substrate-binding protein
VAQKWTISDDRKTYTFTLRPGVTFHNGRAVRADDVVYSIQRAMSEKAKSEKRGFFVAVADVAAPDPATVVITLKHPYDALLGVLASEAGSILPKEVYDDPAEGYLRAPVGCGPFQLASWEPGVVLSMKRFAAHWKPAPQSGAIQRIDVRFIRSSATALEEYRAGGLDFLQELPPGRRAQVHSELPEHLRNAPRLAIFYMGFNFEAGIFKDNPLLRGAVLHAVDRDFIVNTLQEGKDRVATGVIPPEMLGHDPNRPAAVYDPNLSASLLAKAGHPGGKGLPEITYLSNETEGFRKIAERVEADLARVGLKVRVKMTDFGAFLRIMFGPKLPAADMGLFRMTWYADYPDPDNFLAGQFATGAQGNLSRYHDEAFDTLMEQARLEPDRSRRADLYRRGEGLLMDDVALVPLYWYRQDLLLRPEYTAVPLSPLGSFGIAWEEATRTGG